MENQIQSNNLALMFAVSSRQRRIEELEEHMRLAGLQVAGLEGHIDLLMREARDLEGVNEHLVT